MAGAEAAAEGFMSWQLTVFTGLAVVLLAGFGWYERSRPPARLVALVAALAALAVAGRLAFAPIPNVMATTDIALLTGYALGAGPGFAVGALAAPISNIWLGQGPWTVWEMAGWGMAGLIGAGLAAVAGRGLGRFGLATCCALAGLAYGALLDLSVMVTYGGEQSLDRYLALAARGVPFNVAHAAGNFAIAFAIGPALVRMLTRYRTRLEFSWRPAGAVGAALAALCLAGLAAPPPAAEAAGIDRARTWLERAQNPDGGYSFQPGSPSNPKMTGWAMLGLEAAGRNPLDVRRAGRTPVGYLRTNAGRLRRDTGTLQLAILALEGAGVDARGFAGRDLVRQLRGRQAPDASFGGQVNLTAYGILALRAAGSSAGVREAARWLRSARNGDGGWGFGPGRRSEPDSTGSALQGLAVAGGGTGRGVAYLRRTQKREGGWGIAETGITNSQSTAFAVMGLIAARVDPSAVRRRGRSGPRFLARRQARDGHYRYSSRSDQTPVWVTSQALIAVGRQALPIAPVGRSSGGGATPQPDIGTVADIAADAEPATDGAAAGRGGGPNGGKGGEGGQAGGKKPKGAGKGSDEDRSDRLRVRADAPPVVAETAAEADGTEGSAAPYALGGLGALALALAGGFLWYRRRLP
jgi:energy-coupling factor transport system substrate-specific component